MGHLKKAANGHLFKSLNGHLLNDCAGSPENACNACTPPLPDTFYVTVEFPAGHFFEQYNGTHALEWLYTCTWIKYLETPLGWPCGAVTPYIDCQYIGLNRWIASLVIRHDNPLTGCYISWTSGGIAHGTHACNPFREDSYDLSDWKNNDGCCGTFEAMVLQDCFVSEEEP